MANLKIRFKYRGSKHPRQMLFFPQIVFFHSLSSREPFYCGLKISWRCKKSCGMDEFGGLVAQIQSHHGSENPRISACILSHHYSFSSSFSGRKIVFSTEWIVVASDFFQRFLSWLKYRLCKRYLKIVAVKPVLKLKLLVVSILASLMQDSCVIYYLHILFSHKFILFSVWSVFCTWRYWWIFFSYQKNIVYHCLRLQC